MSEFENSADVERITGIVKRFVDAWSPDQRLDLLDFVGDISEVDRDRVIRILLSVENRLNELTTHAGNASNIESVKEEVSGFAEELVHGGVTVSRKINKDPQTRRVGNYELLASIGGGGMGQVFLARHHEFTNRLYAVKLLYRYLYNVDAFRRFSKEIINTGRLQHPNIVHAVDAGRSGDEPYLVMEYVEGCNLSQLIDQTGYLDFPQACKICSEVASGLQHAYEFGMVHRDIKPSNIILSKCNDVKILDFGLAKSNLQTTSDIITQQGQLLGTPDFMAPEQWENPGGVSTSADIYSLGCTLYMLLVGAAPFQHRKGIIQKMEAHLTESVKDIRTTRPSLPDGLATLIETALSKDPASRWREPKEFNDALRRFVADDVQLSHRVDWSKIPGMLDKIGDLGSSNGTFVAGGQVNQPTTITPGTSIELGPNGPVVMLAGDKSFAGKGGAGTSNKMFFGLAITSIAMFIGLIFIGLVSVGILVWMNVGPAASGTIDAEAIFQDYGDSIYLIAIRTKNSGRIIQLGTAFVVDESGIFATNAHCVKAINDPELRNKIDVEDFVLIAPGGKYEFRIKRAVMHRAYRADPNTGPDVGLVVADVPGKIQLKKLPLQSNDSLLKINRGSDLCYIGYPVFGGDDYSNLAKIAPRTFKGVVVRKLNLHREVAQFDDEAKLIEHDMMSWGGASGSPIFDNSGKVVALHFAGMMVLDTATNELKKAPSSIKQGIRVDALKELLEELKNDQL